MTNILLTVSYDGTDFCGWQRQDGGSPARTVQGELEAALEKMLSRKVSVRGSGRTDSGVHAFGQAANFISPVDSVPPENYARALNSLLPRDVRVMESCRAADGFDSRFSATSRVYRYFFMAGRTPFASETRFVWQIPNRPSADVLNSCCGEMLGERDFATFTASGDQSLSTCRYVEDASFHYEEGRPGVLVFQIEANAFLWKMVRSLAGTLIEIERKGGGAAEFASILNSRDRKRAGPTAPPNGLFLYKVKFDGTRRHI